MGFYDHVAHHKNSKQKGAYARTDTYIHTHSLVRSLAANYTADAQHLQDLVACSWIADEAMVLPMVIGVVAAAVLGQFASRAQN